MKLNLNGKEEEIKGKKYIIKIKIMFMPVINTGEIGLEERSKAHIFVREPRKVPDVQP